MQKLTLVKVVVCTLDTICCFQYAPSLAHFSTINYMHKYFNVYYVEREGAGIHMQRMKSILTRVIIVPTPSRLV